jgi:Tfp pilus assembly protein PilF
MVRRRILSLPAIAASIAAVASVPPTLSKALETQRRLVAERPQDPAVLNDLGNLLVLADQPAEAEEAYRKALEIDPNKVTALFNLGLLQQQRGERREALRLYKKAVELQPNHAWAHYQIGTLYEGWDQEGKAVEHYARAFALDPQLAFKEVNPHIVENKLVTQALLRAYGEGGPPPQAPKSFDEPGRIAKLLVPRPQPEAGSADVAQGAQQGQPAQQQDQSGGTVLRQGDLQGRPTGQALPQGRMGRGTVRQPQPTQRGLRQWERPEPGGAPQPQPMDSVEGVQPGQVITPPPGGVYYRPGAPSSGRSELRVVPESQRDARG